MQITKNCLDPTRPDIHKFIRKPSETILDTCCNAGALGYALKQEKDCTVWGIEENLSILKRAEKKLDKVIKGKIEEVISELPEAYFDTVIFPNSFERIIDPYHFLLSLKNCMKPGAQLLISLFNLRQWTVIKSLIEGKWNYDYYGPLMQSNLRLYTQDMVAGLLHNVGFYVDSLYTESEPGLEAPCNVTDSLHQQGLDVSTLKEDSSCTRYIFRAVLPDDRKTEAIANADKLFVSKEFSRALHEYKQILEQNSYSTEALLGAARCSMQLEENKGAIDYLKLLLELDTNHGEAYLLLGSIAVSVGDNTAAEDLLLTAIMKWPSSRRAKEEYGKLLSTIAPGFQKIITESLQQDRFELPHDFSPGEKNRFLVNSIPKAGSNLLTKVIELFPGYQASDIVISSPDRLSTLPTGNLGVLPVGRDGYWGDGRDWNGENNIPIGVDWPLMENLEKIFYTLTPLRRNQYAAGHVPYSPDFSRLLHTMGIRTFVIIRDPRDIVLSHARFVSSNYYNTLFEYYLPLTEKERIMTSIQGIADEDNISVKLLNIRERLDSILAWSNDPEVCMISFERIIGPQGGGTLDEQRTELRKIAEHLSIDSTDDELNTIATQIFGGTQTFRKGMIGSWKEAMTEEHKHTCKKLIGQHLINMGYEKDENW